MFPKKVPGFLFILLIFWVVEFQAQISASQTVGCTPMQVQFSGVAGATNPYWTFGSANIPSSTLSNPNPIYNNAGNFIVTYTAMVNGSPVTYSLLIQVTQAPSVAFSYAIPASRCAPLTATFTGSGGSPGSTYNWSYGDLTSTLNGGISVTHTYSSAGSFSPVLVVLDAATGCTAVSAPAAQGKINVSLPPSVLISSSAGFQSCNPPFTTVFSSTNSISNSPLPGPLQNHTWQFINGFPAASSSAVTGSVAFGSGQHTVSLSLTDNNQCSNTGTALVMVGVPSLSVQIQPTVCIYSMGTVSITASQPFVNLSVSTGTNLTYTCTPNTPFTGTFGTITNSGTITYTAVMSNGTACPPTVQTGSFFVEQITPEFTLTPNVPHTSCQPTFTVSYLNLTTINSGSSLTFTWTSTVGNTFPWGTPAYNQISPTLTITNTTAPQTFTLRQGSSNPYTLYKNFPSVIGLYAQSNSIAQCVSYMAMHVGFDNLWRPNARFLHKVGEGCGPAVVGFTNISTTNSLSPLHTITGYTFHYGTSPTQSVTGTGTMFPLTYTYSAGNTYSPYLVLETADGCIDTSYIHTIHVVNQPTVSASIVNPVVCAGQAVTVNITGTPSAIPGSSVINHWHVETGNRFFSGCISNTSPAYPITQVGTHTVAVSGYQSSCAGTAQVLPNIQVKGPYGTLRYSTNCNNKTVVVFTVQLQDVQTATLSFGDGTPNAIITGVVGGTLSYVNTHTYATTGNYTATVNSVNALNAGCGMQFFSTQVRLRNPNANITYNGQALPAPPAFMGCAGAKFDFSGATSTDHISCGGSGYIWNLRGPNNYTMPTIEKNSPLLNHIIAASQFDTIYHDPILKDRLPFGGTYTISLTVRDENGCKDTETRVFNVGKVTPVFTLNPNPLCLSDGTVTLTNGTYSTLVAPDVVSSYTFDFGDGSGPITSPVATISPTHVYQTANSPFQNFTVSCTAQSTTGCVGTTTVLLKVSNPQVNFAAAAPNPYCMPLGQPANILFSAANGFQTYSVSYGDPAPPFNTWSTSNSPANLQHTYYGPAAYVATMIATDAATGCKGIQQITLNIVGSPTANITFSNNVNTFCEVGYPYAYSTSSINVSNITSTYWLFNGPQNLNAMSSNTFISQTINASGIYSLDLIVSASGCNSSQRKLVYLSNPDLDFYVDKTTFCLGDTIKVTASNLRDVLKWQWFFGDLVPQTPSVVTTPSSATTPTISYPYITYPTGTQNGKTQLSILYHGYENSCPRSKFVDLNVIRLDGDFIQKENIYRHCLGSIDVFKNTTPNYFNLFFRYDWNFGGLALSSAAEPSYKFLQPGVYPVTMKITDLQYKCKGQAVKTITVLPLPRAQLVLQDSACRDAGFIAMGTATPGVSGYVSGTLTSSFATHVLPFTQQNSFTATLSAQQSSTYTLTVTDENGCNNPPVTDSIYIQQRAAVRNWDTTVVIGQLVQLNAYAGSNFTYTWTPVQTGLSCTACPYPVATTTDNMVYNVTVADILPGCFQTLGSYSIYINPVSSLDLPTAFTPNGDGTNDVIYPDGWGIRKLNHFKVFNRWGQLLFETNQYKVGWDGTFNGAPQNMETYVYQVSVETYTNQTLSKSGTFKLIR